MAITREEILDHYKGHADTYGLEAASTIEDLHARDLEVAAIRGYLGDGQRVLEVGCGNGYTAATIAAALTVDIDAFDLSPDLIALARKRPSEGLAGSIGFRVGDVLELDAGSLYDAVYTERALQNLLSWDEQKQALARIVDALKPGGTLIMLECFVAGLGNLNAAREELDLPPITVPRENQFFDEDAVSKHMAALRCPLVEENCALSGYFFGSRVIYPALLPKGKQAVFSSILNTFFAGLESRGDFCPMKILRFVKD